MEDIKEEESRNCLWCGNSFPINKDWEYLHRMTNKKHLFCSSECKDAMYREENRAEIRAKAKERYQKKVPKFPQYKCPKCGKITQLTFDPTKNRAKFNQFKCGC